MKHLTELERVIESGQQTFLEVGVALLTIRDGKLYPQHTFKQYLAERWPQLSVSYVYHLMDATTVVNNIEAKGILPPTVSTQAVKLAILEPDEQAQVWEQIQEQKPTAQQVKLAAYHQYLATHHLRLYQLVQQGVIGVETAYTLYRRVSRLHPDLVTAVNRYGYNNPVITVDTVEAVLMLARRNPDEYEDLLRSGFLQDGNREIPFAQITLRDVERYLGRLHWENVGETTLFALPVENVEETLQMIQQQGGTVQWIVADLPAGSHLPPLPKSVVKLLTVSYNK